MSQPLHDQPMRAGAPWATLRGVVWDWGDTLMRDIPGQAGPMVEWPNVEAMPGAHSAVRALSALPLQCVATNAAESDGDQVAAALERVGLRAHLTHFLTSSEMGVSKPDPAFFMEVAGRLEQPPAALLAVGNDYEKDVVPASEAGMVTVLVCSQAQSPEGVADIVVSDLEALALLAASTGVL